MLDFVLGLECDVVLIQLLLLRFVPWNHSTSPSGGNQVDGLPPALSFVDKVGWGWAFFLFSFLCFSLLAFVVHMVCRDGLSPSSNIIITGRRNAKI